MAVSTIVINTGPKGADGADPPLRAQETLVEQTGRMARGVIAPLSVPVKVSTDDGNQDYSHAPYTIYFAKLDLAIIVYRRGDRHAGTLTGEVMMVKSTDGRLGQSWTDPVTIVANDGGDFRDSVAFATKDRILVFANRFSAYGSGAPGEVRVYESFDAIAFTLIGVITPDLEVVNPGFGAYNIAFVTGKPHIMPGGEIVVGGWQRNSQNVQDFEKAVLFSSTDNARTWRVKSDIAAATFSDSGDPGSVLTRPGENDLEIINGELVSFVRVSLPSGSSLLRVESGDLGATFDTPVDISFDRWGAALPHVLTLPDGRLILTHRNGLAVNRSIAVSYDGGFTFPETNILEDFQQYETMVAMNQFEALSAFGRDSVQDEAADIWAVGMNIGQVSEPAYNPPVPLTAAFDAGAISFDGDLATSRWGPDFVQTVTARQPQPIFDSADRTGTVARFAPGTQAMKTGVIGDYDLLHKGPGFPFTIGISYFIDVTFAGSGSMQNTPIFGTCLFTGSNTGLVIFPGSGNRINLWIMKGSGSGALQWVSATDSVRDTNWKNIIFTYDGTDYRYYRNGHLVENIGPGTGHVGGNSTGELSIGNFDASLHSIAAGSDIYRGFVMDSLATPDEVLELNTWLTR